ncbi:MAG: M56 family metallopeptidase [Thermoleophilaceae bacterium]
MTSARRLYRLILLLGAIGAGVVLLALGTRLGALSFIPPSIVELAAACRSLLLPDVTVGSVVTLVLLGLGFAVLIRTGRSLGRQLSAYRRFKRELPSLGSARVEGFPVTLLDDGRPQAFCAGYLRPRIYLSTGARAALDEEELRAVVAHERHHLRRRDPLRIALVRILADGLFFMPILPRMAERYVSLAELAADEAALRGRDPSALAGALLSFGERGVPGTAVGIAPERVDHLLGRGPRWELPVSLLLGSMVTVGALTALTVHAGPALSAGELNLPLLVLQSCMLVMIALPALVAGSALLFSRPMRTAVGRLRP